VPIFDPKWTRFPPNNPWVPNSSPIYYMLLTYYMIALKSGCSWGKNLPKKAKKWQKRQILQFKNTARFVQYGEIRVKYDMAYYTNTPYDTSLIYIYGVYTVFLAANIQSNTVYINGSGQPCVGSMTKFLPGDLTEQWQHLWARAGMSCFQGACFKRRCVQSCSQALAASIRSRMQHWGQVFRVGQNRLQICTVFDHT